METIERQFVYKGDTSRISLGSYVIEIRVIDDHAVVKIYQEVKNVS